MEQQYQPTDNSQNDESIKKRTLLFNTHVIPHKNLVYKLCIQYTFSSSDIEDNFNEVLINFFKYIETYDPSRSIQTWLHIVTKRFVLDMNKRHSCFKRTEDVSITDIVDDYFQDEQTNGNSMNTDNYEQWYNDEILEALKQMKPIYQEALLLQQAGYKLNEIMDISYKNGNLKIKNIETVKSRLFLAKQQMRKLITRDGEAKEATK